jgi:predicted nucleic acid-binding protein
MIQTVVITDTSVLVNFLVLDRVSLLAALNDHQFTVTEHVRAEITAHYFEQLQRLEQAFGDQVLTEITVDGFQELKLFAELSAMGLGIGECSAIAAAVNRGHFLAIDDKRAIKKLKNLGQSVAIYSSLDKSDSGSIFDGSQKIWSLSETSSASLWRIGFIFDF